jgi:hypothetical protein
MGLDRVSYRPINNVPFHRKLVSLTDFCYATFSLKEYYHKNSSIYDFVLEDMKKETLVSFCVLYGNKGDTKFCFLCNNSKYVVNTVLCNRMKFDDKKMECIIMGLNCENCQNREFTSVIGECFNCSSSDVDIIDIDSNKFKNIIDYHNSGDLVYSYFDGDEDESGDDLDFDEC